MIRIAAVMIVMTAVVPAAGPADPAQEPAAQEPAPRREHVVLPEEDPAFVELLQRLADRAALYRKYALGFTCREAVTEAKYEIDSGGYRKSNRTTYDYLFEERDGRLREVREEVLFDKDGERRRSSDFEPPMPPAYAWATLFSRENRARFHFRPAGQVVKAYRLLTLIDFVGTAPNPGGSDIAGWSGQVALEARSLNLWSVQGAPSGQDVRLEVEIHKYRRAFAIAGVPLAARPHGWQLEVTFGVQHFGLSYPTEQVLSMTSLARSQKMNVEERHSFKYEGYRFFDVATEEEIRETQEQP